MECVLFSNNFSLNDLNLVLIFRLHHYHRQKNQLPAKIRQLDAENQKLTADNRKLVADNRRFEEELSSMNNELKNREQIVAQV